MLINLLLIIHNIKINMDLNHLMLTFQDFQLNLLCLLSDLISQFKKLNEGNLNLACILESHSTASIQLNFRMLGSHINVFGLVLL